MLKRDREATFTNDQIVAEIARILTRLAEERANIGNVYPASSVKWSRDQKQLDGAVLGNVEELMRNAGRIK